jgi:large conductance mechanosensitive channel protein
MLMTLVPAGVAFGAEVAVDVQKLTTYGRTYVDGGTLYLCWVNSGFSFTINGTVFQYGAFIMAVINFFIVAFVLFMLIKLLNKLHSLGKRNEEEVIVEPTTKVCPFCKSEIAIDAVRCAHCTSKLDE